MKRNLKKMLLALMVGVGIMGAVSVQAQTEKVKVYVGPYTSEANGPITGIFTGSVDEICEQYLAADNEYRTSPGYPYYARYPGGGRINSWIPGMWGHWNGGIKVGWLNCPFEAISIVDESVKYTSAMGTGVKCEAGMMYEYAWEGCYEERDNCEPGTINVEGFCVDPCEEARKKGIGQGADGAVLCDGTPCFWHQNIQGWNDMSEQHQGIIRSCILRHEQVHIDRDKQGCYLAECVDGLMEPKKGEFQQRYWMYSERDAYLDTKICYEGALSGNACKGDQDCIDDIKERLRKLTEDDGGMERPPIPYFEEHINRLPEEERLSCEYSQ